MSGKADASKSGQKMGQKTERREGHFEGEGGAELFYQTWSPPGASTRGTLVITHGISEHSEAYAKTAERWVDFGWSVCGWDLRGHGRSEGKRGYVGAFRDFSADLGRLLTQLESVGRLKAGFALIGHSLGGLITLRHLLDETIEAPKPGALVLSSPALGVALAVPKVKDMAARLLHRVLPSLTLYNEIRYQDLTRDPEFLKGYETDALRHDKISPGVYLGMLEAMEFVKARAGELRLPTLIQAAGQERIVSLEGIKALHESLQTPVKKLIVYDESYHEIYNDLDREKAFKDLNEFLSANLSGRT